MLGCIRVSASLNGGGGTSDSYVPQSLPAGEQNEHLSSSDWGSKIMGRDLEVMEIREVLRGRSVKGLVSEKND